MTMNESYLDRVFETRRHAQIVRVKIEAVSFNNTIIKVHPGGTGVSKKRPASDRQVPRRVDHQDSYRVTAWDYDRVMYKRRSEIERLFRRLRGLR